MAIGNGLLNNPVLSGLLGGGGPAAIKAAKDRELAQLRQGIRGRQISAPGAVSPASRESLGTGLSALGSALGDIAKMRKERATRQAIMDSGKPVVTTERVLTSPQMTVNVPGQFNEVPRLKSLNVTQDGIPRSVDATARAQQMLATGNPNEQRLGEAALEALNSASRPELPPARPVETPTNAEDIAEERDRRLEVDNRLRLEDNEQAADLLNLQYTPGYQKVVAEKYEDQERQRAPTMDERVNRLLAAGELGAANKLATIASSQATAKTARLKAQAELAKLKQSGLNDPEKRYNAIIKLQKAHNESKVTQEYRNGQRNYLALKAASKRNDPVADLDMVFAIAKIWDPNSVVRENEQASIKNTGGLPDFIFSAFQALKSGARLRPETRARMMASAEDRMKTFRGRYKDRVLLTKRTADKFGFAYDLTGISDRDMKDFFPVTYKFGD